ncbi:MAG: hypothetical protein WDA60_03755 [Acidimicrobiia bacterium]
MKLHRLMALGGSLALVGVSVLFSSDPGLSPTADGSVIIDPAEPGVGCDPILAVAKVVSGPSTTGFTISVTCTREVDRPAEVEATDTEITVDAVALPYDKDGEPVAASGPAGWSVVGGTWVLSDSELIESTCTATETTTGGAETVSYSCAWTAGILDGIPGVG